MGLTSLLFLGQALLWGLPSGAAEEAEALCSGTACYTIHWGEHSWADSQDTCKSNGGNLVTVKTQEEALHVRDLLAKLPQQEAGPVRLWIGLRREKGTCSQQHQLLKGFSWVAGGEEDARYSAWLHEPRGTCTARRCVTLHWDAKTPGSPAPGWADGACGATARVQGYLCKFSFQGMCPPLALAGPGSVTYSTPFGLASASLDAVPFGSLATITCRPPAAPSGAFAVCKGQQGGGFQWSPPDPPCASPGPGPDPGPDPACASGAPGCEHPCRDPPDGSGRCSCRPGYRPAPDRRLCLPLRPAAPCPGPGCLPQPPPDPRLAAASIPGPAGTSIPAPAGTSIPRERHPSIPGQAVTSIPGPAGTSIPRWRDTSIPPLVGASIPRPAGTSVPKSRDSSIPRPVGTSIPSSRDASIPRPAGTSIPSSRDASIPRPAGTSIPSSRDASIPRPAGTSVPSSRDASIPRPVGTSVPSSRDASIPRSRDTSLPTLVGTTSPRPAGSGTLWPSTSSREEEAEGTRQPDFDTASDGPRLLLYYILGTVVVILLMMAFALGMLVCKKRKAQKEKKKSRSTTDNYCWVPEQAETKAVDNDYRRHKRLTLCRASASASSSESGDAVMSENKSARTMPADTTRLFEYGVTSEFLSSMEKGHNACCVTRGYLTKA